MVTRDSIASWIGNHSNYNGSTTGLGIRCESAYVPKKAVPIAMASATSLREALAAAERARCEERAAAATNLPLRRKRGRGSVEARHSKRRAAERADRNAGVEARIERDASERRASKKGSRRVAESLRAKAAQYDALARDRGEAATPDECLVNFSAPRWCAAAVQSESASAVEAEAAPRRRPRRRPRSPPPAHRDEEGGESDHASESAPLVAAAACERVESDEHEEDDEDDDDFSTRTDGYGRSRRFVRGSEELRIFDAERSRGSGGDGRTRQRGSDARREERRDEPRGRSRSRSRSHSRSRDERRATSVRRRVAGGVRQRYAVRDDDDRLAAAAIALETKRAREHHRVGTATNAAAAAQAKADAAAAANEERTRAADALVAALLEGDSDASDDDDVGRGGGGAAAAAAAADAADALLASLGR